MSTTHALERVIVVPRNGYVNRLQTWASASILAAELDVPLQVVWEPESVAPATSGDLFAPRALSTSFLPSDALDDVLGRRHEEMPRYLTLDADRGVVFLAGHDRGEQVFMADVLELIYGESEPTTLVIVAGGKFHVPEAPAFVRQRTLFYERLPWSEAVNVAVESSTTDTGPHLGLHIRQTDRSREAPTAKTIRSALAALRQRSSIDRLFVAADTEDARDRWFEITREMGFSPWHAAVGSYDRSQVTSGIAAMVDWRLLGRSESLIYPAASSFGEEAAVATGHFSDCVGLTATEGRQRARAFRDLGHSAVTYPRRREWPGFRTSGQVPG